MDSVPKLTADERQVVEEFRKRHRTALLALVFTDVERSTALKAEMGELPASVLMRRHNDQMRASLAEFPEGQEISTAGDSFFIVFAKPSEAVRFALLAQLGMRELAAEIRPDFRVRFGIHMGEVVVEQETEGGPTRDVLGMQVDLAARVCTLAAGGQILMSRGVFDNARQILKGRLLPGIAQRSWLNHGPYLLKGSDEPMEICEVGETDKAPLSPPVDGPAGKRVATPGTEPVLGWRPALEQGVPGTEWTLEANLGEGGFGEVWRARHRRTKEWRVFKFCFRADRLRSLKREMTLFRVLKEVLGERPDIARLYGVQFDEAPYYLELEYTPGGNLADWIAARGGFGNVRLEQRLEIAAQIATALGAAHSVGVLHKDVKPSNVLVEERKDGSVQARLTDFGIGEVLDREVLERAGITATGFTETTSPTTDSSSRSGTRLYMAPELVTGCPPSVQSDVYSLGVLLYQLIIGDLARPMTTDWERRVRDPLLREDLRRCLAGEPNERFAGAHDLARHLRALPYRRARRRARHLALAAGMVLVGFAPVAGLWSWFQSHERQQAEIALARETALRNEAEEARKRAERESYRSDLYARTAEEAGRRAEREEYVAKIWFAAKCIEEARHRRAQETLQSCPTRWRHWEWGWLQARCGSDAVALQGHSGVVTSVAFSADGGRFVTASEDETARIWDARRFLVLLTLQGHKGPLLSAAFSPDGRRVVTASWDETAKIWDAETGRELRTLDGRGHAVHCAAFSPDGRHVATAGGGGTNVLWDAETGQDLWRAQGHKEDVFCVAFSPDGRHLATASGDGTARIWDAASGQEVRALRGHRAAVRSAAFAPDGRRLVTASDDRTARIWDPETAGELLALEGHDGRVNSVAFSPDGRHIVTAGWDGTVGIWDAQTARTVGLLRGHEGAVLSAAFSPDGRRLATAGADKTSMLWNADPHPERVALAGHAGTAYSVGFSPDGHRMVTAGSDRMVRIWDTRSGEELRKLQGHTQPVLFAAFGLAGQHIVSGSQDCTVRIWDAETGRELCRFEEEGSPALCGALSPDGRTVVTWGWETTAKLRQVSNGREIVTLTGHEASINHAAFSPDGTRVVTASSDETARIWEIGTGREIVTLKGHNGGIESAAFNADGRRVVTASRDKTARIWDAESGRERVVLKGHDGLVLSAAFSSDGRRVVTASNDATAKLWDAETGRELATLTDGERRVPILSVAFCPDRERIATARNDGKVILWNARPWWDESTPASRWNPPLTW